MAPSYLKWKNNMCMLNDLYRYSGMNQKKNKLVYVEIIKNTELTETVYLKFLQMCQ